VTAVVVGASAGLGRALSEALAAAGHDLVVVASDARDLAALASDLRIRFGVQVATVALDLGDDLSGVGRVGQAATELGGADSLLLPIGWAAPLDDATLASETAEALVRTNFLAVAAVIAELLPQLQERPRACVVGFGSVAAARGRGANMVYAASKRALQTYFEGLRHSCADGSVRVRFYVLGYLDTSLAFGRRTLLPRADPARLAARVLRELGGRGGVVYHPPAWRVVCALLPLVPFFVYKRLNI
jgi:short-subunit dehydrogenase